MMITDEKSDVGCSHVASGTTEVNSSYTMRHIVKLLVVSSLALACGTPGQESQTETESIAAKRTALKAHLVGTWTRPVRGTEHAVEGIRFDADGRCGLIGIHSMNGLRWLVRGDSVVMTTNTDRYAEPVESRLPVQLVGNDSLVLWAEADYLAGTYERTPEAAYRISGTVTYAVRMALSADAALFLELRDPAVRGQLIASQVVPAEGSQVPIKFHLYYAASDMNSVKQGVLFCTIVAEGIPRFTLPAGYQTSLGVDREDVELWVDAVVSNSQVP
jgi:uncharacterized lipoprotein YbaY